MLLLRQLLHHDVYAVVVGRLDVGSNETQRCWIDMLQQYCTYIRGSKDSLNCTVPTPHLHTILLRCIVWCFRPNPKSCLSAISVGLHCTRVLSTLPGTTPTDCTAVDYVQRGLFRLCRNIYIYIYIYCCACSICPQKGLPRYDTFASLLVVLAAPAPLGSPARPAAGQTLPGSCRHRLGSRVLSLRTAATSADRTTTFSLSETAPRWTSSHLSRLIHNPQPIYPCCKNKRELLRAANTPSIGRW